MMQPYTSVQRIGTNSKNINITTALERPVIQLLGKFESFSLRQFSLCGTVMGLTETIVRLAEMILN